MRVHNVFRVLMRDLKRIAKAPASWVVILVLITLPSLYTWFNVVGFWNPYNNTGALKVCVVNEDEGAHNDLLGDLQLGDQIMDQLHENTQLNWEFTDYDDAMAKISSGEAYAAFVIPGDFSEDMTTLLTGEFQRPQLEYYVNEKLNPVAPKITDTGASTLDNTINDTFVSTVSSVVAETLNDKIAESQESFDASKAKVSTQIDKVDANLSDARESVSGLSTASSDAIAQANSAKASLSDARREIGDMALALSEASALAATLNTEIVSFSGNMSTAISGGLSTVSAASTRANAAVGDAATGIQAAQGDVEYATSVAQNVIDGNKEIISYLQAMADDTNLTQDQRNAVNAAIATLSQSNANAEANLKSMNALAASASSAAGSIANASSTVNDAVQKSVDNGRAYNDDLSKNTIPAVSQGLSGLASTAGSLSGTVARQTSLIDQTSLVLDQLISTLNTTVDALGQTDALLADVQGDIDTVRTDVVALGTSGALAKLFGEDGTLDVNKIADFMQSPTQLETEQLYPLNAYGSAMSPLFINLTLWIGVFMLMVIMHIEVDDEEIRNLTIAQRSLGSRHSVRHHGFAAGNRVRDGLPVPRRASRKRRRALYDSGRMLAYVPGDSIHAFHHAAACGQGSVRHFGVCANPGCDGFVPGRAYYELLPDGVSDLPVHVWHQRHARMHLRFLRKYVAWLHGRACVVLRSFPVHRHICAPLPHEP